MNDASTTIANTEPRQTNRVGYGGTTAPLCPKLRFIPRIFEDTALANPISNGIETIKHADSSPETRHCGPALFITIIRGDNGSGKAESLASFHKFELDWTAIKSSRANSDKPHASFDPFE